MFFQSRGVVVAAGVGTAGVYGTHEGCDYDVAARRVDTPVGLVIAAYNG